MQQSITGQIVISQNEHALFKEKITNFLELKQEIANNIEGDITPLIQSIFVGTLILNGSDIHIEPIDGGADIRARIDGMLHNIGTINQERYKKLLSRIKLLSKLKLNIDKRPQDGRFSIILEETEIEVRTSTLPSQYGETIVMRLLNPKNLISLKDLGLRSDLEELFNKEIKKPNGMIIVTGPTGSGKTTTLYAFLKDIRNPEIKVITIEDPIEYHLDGITQTQVDKKKGYDFASGLKSVVRQDPDAILVGEIRDFETVSIALQAALTGHLVLSTLHTNDAAGAIARMHALGEEAANISPALNIIIAQRLVRKTCKHCSQKRLVTEEELTLLKTELENIPSSVIIPEINSSIEVNEPKGCEFCNNTGYKGRVGMFEALVIDGEMEDYILTSPSSSALEKKAIEKGMTTMKQDGFIKIIQGETTFSEVKRVIG